MGTCTPTCASCCRKAAIRRWKRCSARRAVARRERKSGETFPSRRTGLLPFTWPPCDRLPHEIWRMNMADGNGLMAGKRGLVLGVANNRSIAWGIAKACAAEGAELALTYQGDALKKRVEPLAAELGAIVIGHCDVTDPSTIDAVFEQIEKRWGKLDFLVHAIAFSDKDELTGRYVETTRENFQRTMDISVYSLTAVAKRAEPLMTDGGSILTLTYYGAEKVMPHYNVMG